MLSIYFKGSVCMCGMHKLIIGIVPKEPSTVWSQADPRLSSEAQKRRKRKLMLSLPRGRLDKFPSEQGLQRVKVSVFGNLTFLP